MTHDPDSTRLGLLRAEAMLRPGPFDAAALLWLRCARTATLVLLPLGGIVAVLSGRLDEALADELNTPEGLIRSLATPLALLALGVLLRLLVTAAAFSLAFALVVGEALDLRSEGDDRSTLRRWFDRTRIAGGYRSLRWTWAVRDEAVRRLGARGRRLARVDAWLRVVAFLALVAFVFVAAGSGDSA